MSRQAMKKNEKLLRIGQLAEQSGVSTATIKYYVNEGLLPKPVKTGKNMAYYSPSMIDKIKLIKKIQKEKFLPLEVIKRLIDAGETYEEELELGKAILKSRKIPSTHPSVKESQLERKLDYPMAKVKILEKERLIFPDVINGIKHYDETDCQIIGIMKLREELGVPFEYSVETIRIYRDAISNAVAGDIQLFIRDFIGDIPTQQVIKFMTEADETLDKFMVLFRNKMLRTLSNDVIKEFNDLPKQLEVLNIFPIPGHELPDQPPEEAMLKCFFYLCKGDYDAVRAVSGSKRSRTESVFTSFYILVDLLEGKVSDAIDKVERLIPKPSAYILNNAIAALAYVFSVREATGFSTPMFQAKKMLAYLKRIEKSDERYLFSRDFAHYVCGAVYIMLPESVRDRSEGLTLLTQLDKSSTRGKLIESQYPEWLVRTLDYEILPAMEIRRNRFLAEGYRREGKHDQSLACLTNIIDIADPQDEHGQWARQQRLLNGQN